MTKFFLLSQRQGDLEKEAREVREAQIYNLVAT
jgi:hypothetical protein